MSEMSDMHKLIMAMKLAKTAQVGLGLTYFDVIELLGELDSLKSCIAELEVEVTKGHELQDSYCDRIAELEARIAELEAQQRWIPVSERLPENKFEHVLVCTTYGVSVRLALEIGEAVTHWMPLPNPPEVKNE